MDQRYYSPLSRSSEKPIPPLASNSTLLSLCTGLDGEIPENDVPDSVDTEVVERINPAVTHEHVQPREHTKIEHRITREVHTHDVYHRVLPIIQTEILPPRYFIDDGQDIREVPKTEVWKYTVTGAPAYRHVKSPRTKRQLEPDTSKREPAVPLVAKLLEPILADKKTYMTERGYPRTEYLWLHPPVFEDSSGRTQPVLIPAGLSPEWKARLGVADSRSQQQHAASLVVMDAAEYTVPTAKRRRGCDSESSERGQDHEATPPQRVSGLSPDTASPGRTGPNDQLFRETEEYETRRTQQSRKK